MTPRADSDVDDRPSELTAQASQIQVWRAPWTGKRLVKNVRELRNLGLAAGARLS
jgi:hypothetical protein